MPPPVPAVLRQAGVVELEEALKKGKREPYNNVKFVYADRLLDEAEKYRKECDELNRKENPDEQG